MKLPLTLSCGSGLIQHHAFSLPHPTPPPAVSASLSMYLFSILHALSAKHFNCSNLPLNSPFSTPFTLASFNYYSPLSFDLSRRLSFILYLSVLCISPGSLRPRCSPLPSPPLPFMSSSFFSLFAVVYLSHSLSRSFRLRLRVRTAVSRTERVGTKGLMRGECENRPQEIRPLPLTPPSVCGLVRAQTTLR